MVVSESIKDGDYKIQQISRLLESGGTMLAQHCNVCGAPFFRYHGEILCPVCSTLNEQTMGVQKEEPVSSAPSQQESVTAPAAQPGAEVASTSPEDVPEVSEKEKPSEESFSETELKPPEPEVAAPSPAKPEVPAEIPRSASSSESLEKALLMNIEDVAAKMVGEDDIQKVTEKLDLIERTLALAERIKKL